VNTQMPAVVTVTRSNHHPTVVETYGFPMEVTYEYDEGEPTIWWPTELAHPGSPPNVQLLTCKVGGQDIYDMLTPEQVTRIEDSILDQLER
jgi:hypothetical protein